MARRAGSSRRGEPPVTPSAIRPSWWLLLLGCCCAAVALVAVAPSASSRRRAAPAAEPPPPPPILTPFHPDLPLLSLGKPLPPRPSEPECQDLLRRYLEDHPSAPVPYRRPDDDDARGAAAATEATTPAAAAPPRLFFLHIPRTAGRTVHYCLLVQGTRPRWRCPRAYAGVSLDDAKNAAGPAPPLAAAARRCHLLSSHDDFSLAQALVNSTSSGVAAVTQLRDPVQRVLSAYEFVVTHALNLAKLAPEEEEALDALGREQGRLDTFVTRVWPWSELVPLVVRDVRERRDKLRLGLGGGAGGSAAEGSEEAAAGGGGGGKGGGAGPARPQPRPRNPYDSPDVAMPLAEFLRLPVARDLLFEGQAMQVLGLTANSRWQPGADRLRACALRPPPPPLGPTATAAEEGEGEDGGLFSSSAFIANATSWPVRNALLELAARRLRAFAHVGVSERVRESAEGAAAALGLDVETGAAYGRQGNALDYEEEEDDGENGEQRAREERQARSAEAATTTTTTMTTTTTTTTTKKKAKAKGDAIIAQVQPLPLGRAFLKCAARYREADKRAGGAALEGVPVPAGAPPMCAFSGRGGGRSGADARASLVPPELLAWLREQNQMDARLHELATKKLDAARERWRRRGSLQVLSAEEEERAKRVAAAAGDGPLLKAMKGRAAVDGRGQQQDQQDQQQDQQQQQQQVVV
jgi:hypothetical protein